MNVVTRPVAEADLPDPQPGGMLALAAIVACAAGTIGLLAVSMCSPAGPADGAEREPATSAVRLSTSSSSTTTRAFREPLGRVSRQVAPAGVVPSAAGGGVSRRSVDSTAYCLTGRTASGVRAFDGAVAMNGQPFGSRWRVLSGPLAGRVLVVADRIHHGSDFDVAMPGDCQRARAYGRRTITVERIG